jgi:hypothetical protein
MTGRTEELLEIRGTLVLIVPKPEAVGRLAVAKFDFASQFLERSF